MGTTDLPLGSLEDELRPAARERIAKGQIPREAATRAADMRDVSSGWQGQPWRRSWHPSFGPGRCRPAP